MPQRLALSQGAFCLGLVLMLGTGLVWATAGGGYRISALMLAGAAMALVGWWWHHRLRRAARNNGTLIDLGGYPLDLLRGPGFHSRGRTA